MPLHALYIVNVRQVVQCCCRFCAGSACAGAQAAEAVPESARHDVGFQQGATRVLCPAPIRVSVAKRLRLSHASSTGLGSERQDRGKPSAVLYCHLLRKDCATRVAALYPQHGLELDQKYKLPKMRCFAGDPRPQRIRKDPSQPPLVEEIPGAGPVEGEEPSFALRTTRAKPEPQKPLPARLHIQVVSE